MGLHPGPSFYRHYVPSLRLLTWIRGVRKLRDAPGVLGMVACLPPLDGIPGLAARDPATARPLIEKRDILAL